MYYCVKTLEVFIANCKTCKIVTLHRAYDNVSFDSSVLGTVKCLILFVLITIMLAYLHSLCSAHVSQYQVPYGNPSDCLAIALLLHIALLRLNLQHQ